MLKTGSGVSVWKRKMHLLVMIAERIRDAKFGNVHQPSFSIPGGREEGKMRRRTLASPPKTTSEHLQKSCDEKPLQQRNPPSAQVCMCVCVCVRVGGGGWSGWSGERERESEETGECATMSVWAAERQKWMFACSVSASLRLKSLMNMEQLLLAAASGGGASAHWWGGATLRRGRGNSRRRGWCAVCWNTPTDIAHKQPAFTTDWSKYTWNHTDKTLLCPIWGGNLLLSYFSLFCFVYFRTGLLFTTMVWKICCHLLLC